MLGSTEPAEHRHDRAKQDDALCPVCSSNVGAQLGRLLQRYEQLQELVESVSARQTTGKGGKQRVGKGQVGNCCSLGLLWGGFGFGVSASSPTTPCCSMWLLLCILHMVLGCCLPSPQQDEELLKHIQAAIAQVQWDCEKLSCVTGNLVDDQHQRQRDIEVGLSTSCRQPLCL